MIILILHSKYNLLMCQNRHLIIVYNYVITWCKTIDETMENTSRREKYSL